MKALKLILFVLSIMALGCTDAPTDSTTIAPPETFTWPASTLSAEQLDSTAIFDIHSKIKKGDYGNIDRMLIIRNGNLVFDESYRHDYKQLSKGVKGDMGCGYQSCPDSAQINNQFNYYHPHQHPFYHGSDLHTLQSVTKSIAATIVGIAIKEGHIKSVDETVLSFLDNYDLSKVDDRLKKATLKNLLCMQLGMEWHEMQADMDSTNSCHQLECSQDWVQFVLDQPMESEPGEKWEYNSGASQLLSAIIKKTTGKYIDDYAREVLFGPLGIDDFHWKKTPTGLPDTEGGLYLKPLDLAKIGQLYLQDGLWNGQQIMTPGWAKEATHPWVTGDIPGATGYSYQWWLFDLDGKAVYFALGFGGQMMAVFPDSNTVGVLNAWNVFDEEVENILRAFVLALN